jgi:hypothetical protein
VWTARLNEDGSQAGPDAENTITTKILLARHPLPIAQMSREPKKAFQKIMKLGKGEWTAVAECEFRKETVCTTNKKKKNGRASKVCAVKKQIKCLQVCKLEKWTQEIDTVVHNMTHSDVAKAKSMTLKEYDATHMTLKNGKSKGKSNGKSKLRKSTEFGVNPVTHPNEPITHVNTGLVSGECFKTLCNGTYGELACNSAALSE